MRLRVLSIGLPILAVVTTGLVVAWPAVLAQAKAAAERRLALETGRPWRIGHLSPSLLPTPGLVLDDVAVGGEGCDPCAAMRRLRIAVPVAVLLGRPGSGEAVAEDVTLSLTAASAPARAGRTAGALHPSAIRVRARGAEMRPSPSRDGVTVTIRSVELGVDLAAAATEPAIRLDVDLAKAGTVLEVDRPGADGGRPVRLTIEPASGAPIAATATARMAGTTVTVDAIAGRIGRAPFSGSLSVDRAGKPRLVASLRLDALAVTGDERAPPRGGNADTLSVALSEAMIPDVAWFRPFDAKADIAVASLALGPAAATDVAATIEVKDGSLDAALLSAQAYGGSARGRYVLGPDGTKGGRHQIGFSLTDVRAGALLGDLAGIRGLDGTGTARLDIQATGTRGTDLLGSAAGTGTFAVVDGRIDGLDLARAAGFALGAGGGLATRLDRLGGTVAVADGQAVTDDLHLKTGLMEAEGVGSLDLVGRTLDIRLKPLKVVPGSGGRIDVPVRISGPWADPAVTADVSGLARDPGSVIQGLKDLGGGLLGDEAGGLGGLLDSLLPQAGPPRRKRP